MRKMLRSVLLLCLLWVVAGRPLWAQQPIDIGAAFWEPYPERHMEYVAQPSGVHWSLKDVEALPDTAWHRLEEDYGVYFGLSTKGYWLRFRVTNSLQNNAPVLPKFYQPEPDSLPVLLECNNPNLDTLHFYRVSPEGGVLFMQQGNRVQPEARPLNYPNLVFRWKEPLGASARVYLYVRSYYYTTNFTFSFWSEQRWQLNFKQVEIGAGILFFALVLVYLFSLTLLFAIVRERHLWLFYFYALLSAFFFANDLDIWYWFWPGWDYRIFSPTAINLGTVCGLLFMRYYFQTYRRYRYFDWGLILLSAVALATTVLSLLLHQNKVLFLHLNKVLLINLLITCAAIMGLFLYDYYTQRKREKIWFVIGFTPHGLAIVLACVHQLDWFHPKLPGLLQFSPNPSPFFVQMNTPWMLLGGMIWEMLIVSMLFVVRVKSYYESSNKILAERRNALVLGVETERKRVAQDLHDGIGVLLSSTKMKLAALRDQMKGKPDWYQETGELLSNIDQAHEEMRALAHNMMPKSLEKLGLAQAIEGAVSRLRRSHPAVQWRFYSNFQNGHLDELTKINLFRIAQEMLHNILQHAQATEAHLQLLRQGTQIVLSIEDNGVGFQPKNHTLRTGIGLSNIRYRAEDVLKGHVTIESSPGKGAFIAVEIPVGEEK
jgi:signal transduction histidine kinase